MRTDRVGVSEPEWGQSEHSEQDRDLEAGSEVGFEVDQS